MVAGAEENDRGDHCPEGDQGELRLDKPVEKVMSHWESSSVMVAAIPGRQLARGSQFVIQSRGRVTLSRPMAWNPSRSFQGEFFVAGTIQGIMVEARMMIDHPLGKM